MHNGALEHERSKVNEKRGGRRYLISITLGLCAMPLAQLAQQQTMYYLIYRHRSAFTRHYHSFCDLFRDIFYNVLSISSSGKVNEKRDRRRYLISITLGRCAMPRAQRAQQYTMYYLIYRHRSAFTRHYRSFRGLFSWLRDRLL